MDLHTLRFKSVLAAKGELAGTLVDVELLLHVCLRGDVSLVPERPHSDPCEGPERRHFFDIQLI